MSEILVAQADVPTMLPFPVPGHESLPGWILAVGGLFYIGLLAWNAAQANINAKRAIRKEIEKAETSTGSRLPDGMQVIGGAIADRGATQALADGAVELADAIRDATAKDGPLLAAVVLLGVNIGRLADLSQKRLTRDEKDDLNEEIERRARELAAKLAKEQAS